MKTMKRKPIGDKTEHILRGVMYSRGMTGASTAKALKKPATTVTYQIRHAESMAIEDLRRYVDLYAMTDAEIVKIIRGTV